MSSQATLELLTDRKAVARTRFDTEVHAMVEAMIRSIKKRQPAFKDDVNFRNRLRSEVVEHVSAASR
jgi:hypothetical protein